MKNLRAERVELEHNVKLLRTESLNKDMLEEQAKKILGIAAPNEQVFTIKDIASQR
ncbi:Phosphatidate cytidylyltransferase [Rickettsia prowazekii str. NMRC Madrid E]|nr:Phosphatidate cytidylyltransferase [Rickettsia prowazekii str. NMRC Madrid E]